MLLEMLRYREGNLLCTFQSEKLCLKVGCEIEKVDKSARLQRKSFPYILMFPNHHIPSVGSCACPFSCDRFLDDSFSAIREKTEK